MRDRVISEPIKQPNDIICVLAKLILAWKSKKLFKSVTKEHDVKKHLSPLVVVCDRKHANRIPPPKVVVSVVV